MKKFWKIIIPFVVGLGLFSTIAYWESPQHTLLSPAFSREIVIDDAITQKTSSYLTKIRGDRAALRSFLQKMPKGGELHTHLSGHPTPERLLELAANSKTFRYFIRVPNQTTAADDPQAYTFVAITPGAAIPLDAKSTLVPVTNLLNPQTETQRQQLLAYRQAQIISPTAANPNNIFFNAIFARNDAVTGNPEIVKQMLADVVTEAHDNHLSYIEPMFSPFPNNPAGGNKAEEYKVLNVTTAREYLKSLLAAVQTANQKYPENERVEVGFMLSFRRTSQKIFTQLPIAFELAAGNDEVGRAIAGINFVGNEYSEDPIIGKEITAPSSLDNYISTLRRIYPTVRLSIHAGESNQWDWHIRDSILMGADRIGHGVNLAKSPLQNSPDMILMRRRKILVEACLTSNSLLLKLPIPKHPFLSYLRAGIPVSLNTDDQGIFETNITEEFARAVENHPSLKWQELKQMARYSLEYAFVDENIKDKLISRWEKDMGSFESSLP